MIAWMHKLAALDRAGIESVLITILSVRGSAPREAGCKMVVTQDSAHGTIGGGALEYEAVARARALLASGGTQPTTWEAPLGPELAQCCGGHVSVLFEPMRPPALRLALFGAGHVGTAVARLLADLPCRVMWIDPRADLFPSGLPPHIETLHVSTPENEVASLPHGMRVLVMTHSHALDYAIVAAALARPDLGRVGLIGSMTKRARFTSRLRRAGVDMARLDCPVGLPGIAGKHPAEIAIGIVAQMLTGAERPAPELVLPCAGCAA